MELQLANHSSYPRIGDTPEGHLLRRTIAQREKGEKTGYDVDTAEDKLTEMALAVIPRENVWVDPDCGLKTRSVDEAIAKMKVTVQTAKALRN